jgi:hypothetical protein
MFVRHCRTLLVATVLLAGSWWLPDAGAQGRSRGRSQSEITGTVEMVVVDAPDFRSSRHEYFLKEDRGTRMYELRFGHLSPGQIRSGMRLSVTGTPVGRRLYVESMKIESRDSSDATADASAGEAAAGDPTMDAATLTQRRAVVLMVDMTDAKASTRYTLSQIAANLYTGTSSMDGLYRDASLGQLGFAPDTDGDTRPDVFGPFAIPYSASANCSYYDWAYAAESAATAAGIDLSRYQHRVFALPHHSLLTQCTWAGVANVGCGTFCRAWIAESESPMVYAHELGHNLNLAHAGTDPENDGTINSAYGDQSDPMGSSRAWRRFNGAHVHQLGWLAAYPGSFQSVTASGTYQLLHVGAPASTTGAPRTMRIAKPDSGDYYYLSYRESGGYDSGLASTYTQGVSVHRYSGSGYSPTSLVKVLTDGASIVDGPNGIVVSQVSHGAGLATVTITVPAASTSCTAAAPAVSLSPGSKYARPGASVSIGASLRNGDGTDCAPTTFSLAYGGTPAATLAPGTMTLTGGQTGSSTLSVSSPLSEGSYSVQVQARDSDGASPSHTAVTSAATLVVDGTAPSVPTGLRASAGHRSIDLTWSASTDARSGVAGYVVLRNGVTFAETTALSYSDSRISAGTTYSYSIVAKDRAGNSSAASTAVRATAGSVKGGGGGRKK